MNPNVFILNKKQAGSGLVELVLSITIIAVALTGTLLAFQTASLYNADPMLQQQAISIGKSYLSEVTQKDFPTTVPCPSPPAGGRSVYTNVCDYHNLVDVGAKTQAGQAISGLGGYTITVTVDTAGAVLGSLTTGTEVVRIDVLVQHNNMPNVRFSGYRTLYS